MARATFLSTAFWLTTLLVGCTATVADQSEEARILELLKLDSGSTVADVGAGDGDFSVLLAGEVGLLGRVLATEVDQDLIDDLSERAESSELPQIQPVLGDQERTGLEADCCSAILLRRVYHHFADPQTMGADLWRALERGGRLLVIDFEPQDDETPPEGVPDRGGHGVLAKELIQDLTGLGFETVTHETPWDGVDHYYAVLFRKP